MFQFIFPKCCSRKKKTKSNKAVTNNIKPISRVKWQWRSNSDPWSKTEKPQWTSYPPERYYLLENAYHNKQKEVDLGDHIISIKHMLQSKKGNLTSQRPIRRISYEEEEEEEEETEMRIERYFETELPKTINNVFGNLTHFISFFSRRNPNILNFVKQFQGFEQSNDFDGLNNEIRPQLIHCLGEELLKPIENQLQDHSISEFGKRNLLRRKSRHEELINLFKNEFASFEELYCLILRSYTMSTDLYLNLNKYLRNESWTAIDNLLPYVICLCKAFFSFKQTIPLQESDELQEIENSMMLYRGTALDEYALNSYKTEKDSKLFSWNSVTSTSTNREMAENFMYLSAEPENKKYPVMFIIEIPLASEITASGSEYMNWVNISQYSAQPKEDEVILAPGCTFEVRKIFTDKENRTTINLKLRHEVESLAHGGLIMQGAFQTEMMNDKQFKIMCLGGKELSEAFKNISGNKLVEEIEFCLCQFNNDSLEEMMHTLPTLEKTKVLNFVACKYEDEKGISSIRLQNVKSCNILKIEMSEVQDLDKMFSIQNDNEEYWRSLRRLIIEFRNPRKIKEDEAKEFLFQGLRNLTQIKSLSLDFPHGGEISNEGVNYLVSQELKHLKQLTSLTMNFLGCSKITSQGVRNLVSEGLQHLTQLTFLNLYFCDCCQIPDYDLKNLEDQALQCITSLRFFISNNQMIKWMCPCCYDIQMNEEEIESIQDLKRPKQKTQRGGKNFQDFLLLQLKRKNAPKRLESNYSFPSEQSKEFTSKCLSELVNPQPNENLKTLFKTYHLTSFTFKLYQNKITDEQLRNLVFHGLKYLTQLTSLDLGFSYESKITDEGMNDLSQGLRYLTELTSLTLDFSWCVEITDEGVSNLAIQGLKHLTKLTSLELNFSWCIKISDEGVSNLASQGLRHLTQLTSLNLNFYNYATNDIKWDGITDKGVNDLASQGLRYLIHLTSLILVLPQFSKITDNGVDNLTIQGLKYLRKLTILDLNFSWCKNVTDVGVNSLIDEIIKRLIQLSSLTLDVRECSITTFTISNIERVLHYFGLTDDGRDANSAIDASGSMRVESLPPRALKRYDK